MATKGPETGAPPDPPADEEDPKKRVGKVALKKKPSRPPWAHEAVREVPPDKLTPLEPKDGPQDPEPEKK